MVVSCHVVLGAEAGTLKGQPVFLFAGPSLQPQEGWFLSGCERMNRDEVKNNDVTITAYDTAWGSECHGCYSKVTALAPPTSESREEVMCALRIRFVKQHLPLNTPSWVTQLEKPGSWLCVVL